jgi:hypothetical protein
LIGNNALAYFAPPSVSTKKGLMRFPPAVVHEADVRSGVVGADRGEGEGEQLLRVEVPPRPPVVVVVAFVPTDQLVVVPRKNVNFGRTIHFLFRRLPFRETVATLILGRYFKSLHFRCKFGMGQIS